MTATELNTAIQTASAELDTMWIMISAFLVFFMQAGFAMLEMGTVRSKNAMNILIKNLLDVSMATVFWFLIGQGVAQGAGDKNFLGTSQQAGSNVANQGRDWLFQWAFAGTASTIVSGCLAERCFLGGQVIVSILLTAFVQPAVVHWTWTEMGWLKELGYSDFAGSGIVHMLGGFCGLIGAIFLGPRIGRFDPETNAEEFKPHNVGMVVLGTLILWFGWYGFNGGSALGATGANSALIGLVCMNTTLSAAMGGLTSFVLVMIIDKVESVGSLANGLLAGLVGITASCDSANHYMSLLIGFVSGLILIGSAKLLVMLKVDDPLDAFSVHGACGLWGVIASGIVHATVASEPSTTKLTGCLIGAGVIIGWTVLCSVLIFLPLSMLKLLRVSPDIEIKGLDEVFHGGLGYNLNSRRASRSASRPDTNK